MAEIVFSAKFKRDYVAASAVVLFFLIVIGEVVLAVGIPCYLGRENTLALQVRRVRLLEEFDQCRFIRYRTGSLNETANSEARLVNWNLDLLANYLRTESNRLTDQEITVLQRQIRTMNSILLSLQNGGGFCRELHFDPSIFLNSLLK